MAEAKLCRCGCGTSVRNIWARGHNLHHSFRGTGWPRKSSVTSVPIWRVLNYYKEKHNLTWVEISVLVGEKDKTQIAHIGRHKWIQKERAERILRSLAGLPRRSTLYEQQLARRDALEKVS